MTADVIKTVDEIPYRDERVMELIERYKVENDDGDEGGEGFKDLTDLEPVEEFEDLDDKELLEKAFNSKRGEEFIDCRKEIYPAIRPTAKVI